MKSKINLFACLISVLALTACQSQPQYQSHVNVTLPSGQEIVSGQLIVRFKESTPLTMIKAIAEKYQMIIYQEIGNNSYVFASNKNVKKLEKTMLELKSEPVLDNVTYNRITHTMSTVIIEK